MMQAGGEGDPISAPHQGCLGGKGQGQGEVSPASNSCGCPCGDLTGNPAPPAGRRDTPCEGNKEEQFAKEQEEEKKRPGYPCSGAEAATAANRNRGSWG